MAEDLSQIHRLVGDLFHGADDPDYVEQCRLTDEQVQFYHENGYLAGVRVLSDRQIDVLREELAEFFQADKTVVEDHVAFHALFLRQPLQ